MLLLLFLVLGVKVSYGQIEYPEDKVSWKFTVEQNGDEAYIVGTITMVEHWHIYACNLPEEAFSLPTEVKLMPNNNYKAVGVVKEPNPIYKFDEMADEHLYYHSNTVKLRRKIKVLSEDDFVVEGEFFFQTCDDDHCLPPHTAKFSVNVKGVQPKEETPEDVFENAEGDEVEDDKGQVYVKVNGSWHPVPEGNSVGFYKKYIALSGKDEE